MVILRIILEVFISRSGGEFLFWRFWFISFLFIFDFRLQKRLNVFFHKSFFLSGGFFVLSSALDYYFLFRGFDNGIPLISFLKSFVSFFALAQGIPKLSLTVLFASRLLIALYHLLFLKSPGSFRHILSIFVSYFVWHILHLNILYGKSSVLVSVGVDLESAYLLNGITYFILTSIIGGFIKLGDFIKNFIRSEIKDFSFSYNLIISFIGYSLGERSYLLKIVAPFLGVLAFRTVQLVVQILRKKIVEHNYALNNLDVLILFLTLSLFASLRGILLMTLPFVLLLMFIYYVPPVELRKNILGSFFVFIFFFFLVLISYLSSVEGFFITSETFSVAFGCGLYALFDNLTEKFSGTVKRIFASATAILPVIFLHLPEDIAVYFFLAVLSFIFSHSKIPRVLSAVYFVGKFYYLKSIQLF